MQTFDDFEPLSYYINVLKGKFRKNAEECFDSLVKQSGVNAEENKKTVGRYNAASAKAAAAEKKLNSCKVLRGFVIFFLIAAAIAGVFLILAGVDESGHWAFLLGGILCIVLAVVLLVLLFTKLRHMLETRQKKYDAAVQKANAIRDEAYAQMSPLNALFTARMTRELIEKTEPDIQIDDYFDMKKFELMSRKYGLRENDDHDSSTVCVLSGMLEGNPFLYERDLNCRIREHVYTGSIVIHWTTYTTDSKGRRQAVHHSQTLTATYSAPAPVYGYNTRMYYGNEAAPDLSFSREPTYAHNLSESEVERKVKKGKKQIAKRARKALETGKSQFTEMGNAEFDVLFGALDRDNEVQFRLMFTPLAQKNMLGLIRSDEAYGDDFSFVKRKRLNCIRSAHAQNWQIEPDVGRYKSYDLAASRAEFVNFNCEYFRSVYFDLAPVLAIPLYKMQKPREFIYKDVYYRNCTSFETEALANRFDESFFAHRESKTRSILKAQFVQKDGAADKVKVVAYSYNAVPRVAHISVFGGDGRMHDVPVPWTEYIPLTRTSVMEVKAVGGTFEEFRQKHAQGSLRDFMQKYSDVAAFSNGLLAIPIVQGIFDASSDSALDGLLGRTPAGQWSEGAQKVADALAKAEEAEREVAAAEAPAEGAGEPAEGAPDGTEPSGNAEGSQGNEGAEGDAETPENK